VLRYAEFEGVDPVEYEDDQLVGARPRFWAHRAIRFGGATG
jgi:hypothetical protein